MPRKDFQRDLCQAANAQFSNLRDIKAEDNDGSITFKFFHRAENIKIEFQAVVSGGW